MPRFRMFFNFTRLFVDGVGWDTKDAVRRLRRNGTRGYVTSVVPIGYGKG